MSGRKWLPVAPSIFDQVELSPTQPYEDGTVAPAWSMNDLFAGEEGTVDRSAKPIIEVLTTTHSDIIFERRAMTRELRRLTPRPGVLRSINERIAFYEEQQEKLLLSLTYHEQTWAHLAEDCLICDRSVAWTRGQR